MEDARCLLIFLGMILLVPLWFGIAYIFWNISHWLALAVLFIGISADLLGGFTILDQALSRA